MRADEVLALVNPELGKGVSVVFPPGTIMVTGAGEVNFGTLVSFENDGDIYLSYNLPNATVGGSSEVKTQRVGTSWIPNIDQFELV